MDITRTITSEGTSEATATYTIRHIRADEWDRLTELSNLFESGALDGKVMLDATALVASEVDGEPVGPATPAWTLPLIFADYLTAFFAKAAT